MLPILVAERGRRCLSEHFVALPVEFIADAISTLGANVVEGFETYHVMNPYDDGIGMDTYVDWLIEAGYPIARVPGYAAWLERFDTTLRALPEKQLPVTRTPDQRVPRAGGSLPGGRAGRQDRAGQGRPAHLRPGDRQVHHRPGAARPALTGTQTAHLRARPPLTARRWAFGFVSRALRFLQLWHRADGPPCGPDQPCRAASCASCTREVSPSFE
jgi:hypothetical protein